MQNSILAILLNQLVCKKEEEEEGRGFGGFVARRKDFFGVCQWPYNDSENCFYCRIGSYPPGQIFFFYRHLDIIHLVF